MTYAGNRRINDADSHLMELPDFLTRNADPGCRKDIGGLLDRDMGFFELDAYAGQGSHAPERRAGLGTRMEQIFNPLFLLYFFELTAVRNSSFVPAPRAGIRYGGPAHQAGALWCNSSAQGCLKGAGPPYRTPTLSLRSASVPRALARRVSDPARRRGGNFHRNFETLYPA